MALGIPGGIILGVILGISIGFALVCFFRRYKIRDTKKVLIFMAISILFFEFCELQQIKEHIAIAGLLGIMSIGFVILERYNPLAKRLSAKFNKLWVLSEILLFVYIGTETQINMLKLDLLFSGLSILAIGLTMRSFGVWVSLIGSKLDRKEKLFCVIAYLPKATVQAAIGAIPLSMILSGEINSISAATGNTILTLAVLSIVTTAPLGAIGIKLFGDKLLKQG